MRGRRQQPGLGARPWSGASQCALVPLGALLVLGCPAPPPYAVLKVEDPDQLAPEAVALQFGERHEDMKRIDLEGKGLPATFAITGEGERRADIWVHAEGQERQILAVGFVQVTLAVEQGPVHSVVLTPSCSVADEGTPCLTSRGALLGRCSTQLCRGPVWELVEDGGGRMDDQANDVAFDPWDNMIVVGVVNAAGESLHAAELWIAKYSPAGELLWRAGVPGVDYSYALGVAVDSQGNAYVAGLVREEGSGEDAAAWIGKYSSEGELVKQRTVVHDTQLRDFAQSVAIDSRGRVVVGGGVDDPNPFWPEQLGEAWLAKYDSELDQELWSHRSTFADLHGRIVRVACDAQDNIYAVGMVEITAADTDGFIAKYDPEGDQLWPAPIVYSSSQELLDSATGLAVDTQGRVDVAGTVDWSPSTGDIWIHQYSGDGERSWERFWFGPGNGMDRAIDLATDLDDNVVVVGFVSQRSNDSDPWLGKFDSLGNLIWQLYYVDIERLNGFFTAVATDSQGGIAVCGGQRTFSGDYDITVLRYEP